MEGATKRAEDSQALRLVVVSNAFTYPKPNPHRLGVGGFLAGFPTFSETTSSAAGSPVA